MNFGLEHGLPDPSERDGDAPPEARRPLRGRLYPLSVVDTPAERLDVEREDATFSLIHYWRLVLKYRWLLLCALALGLAAGVVATLLTTPVYEASATVQIDEEPAKVVAVESQRPVQAANTEKFYQTQYELLKSRALAQRVVANEALANDPRFMGQWDKALGLEVKAGPARSGAAQAARAVKAAALVSKHLRIEPVRLSRIVKISYEGPDAAMAAKVANAVAANYINWNLERRYEASSVARKFLEERLEQTRQTLEEAQRRGNEYAQRNELITVDGGDDSSDGRAATGESLFASNLVTVNAQLAAATATRIQAEQRWNQAKATPDMALPEVLANGPVQSLKTSRDTAMADYQQNLRIYKPDWPAMIDARKKIDALDQQLATQIASIRNTMLTELEIARKNENQFRFEFEKKKHELLESQSKRVEKGFIDTDINTSKSLYDGMLASYKEIGVAGGIGDNNISFVDKADIPREAVKPEARTNLIQFGLAGLILGALIGFLRDRFDLSIKSPADVESELHLPLLGTIPLLPKNLTPGGALEDPKSPLSEAYCSVRAALQFATENGAPPSLLVSSSRPSEGKTTSSLAIAAGFARLGLKVLLIDGDMRDPSLHKILGRDNGTGLSNLLAGGPDVRPALQPSGYKNLTFLACGPLPPNPAELLGGGKMRSLLASAVTHYDLVVIDGPPVMGFADAPLLASAVAGVVFAVSAGETRRDNASAALHRLRAGKARLFGAVLTKFDVRKDRHGAIDGYGYDYDYGSPAASKRGRFALLPSGGWFAGKTRRA